MNTQNKIQNKNYTPTIFDFFASPLKDFDFMPTFAKSGNFKCDIKDCGESYELKADLPGVKKEDIVLDFNDHVLSLTAKHHKESENKDEKGYMIHERCEGTYTRQFRFDDVNADDIEAKFDNGELCVKLTKKVEDKSNNICIHQKFLRI